MIMSDEGDETVMYVSESPSWFRTTQHMSHDLDETSTHGSVENQCITKANSSSVVLVQRLEYLCIANDSQFDGNDS